MGILKGTNWGLATVSPQDFKAVAISANGNYITAVSDTGDSHIYTSSNRGLTWATHQVAVPADSPRSVSMSDDGAVQTVATYGCVYVSTNSGLTWTLVSLPTYYLSYWFWNPGIASVAVSGDGTYQAMVPTDLRLYPVQEYPYYGYLITSNDNWATITTRQGAGVRNWIKVTLSDTGQYVAALGEHTYTWNGQQITELVVFMSSTYGSLWTIPNDLLGLGGFSDICMTPGGALLAKSVETGRLYSSTDHGATWTSKAAPSYATKIACSSNGAIISTIDTWFKKCYTSINSGDTWTEITESYFTGDSSTSCRPTGIDMSADGAVQVSSLGGLPTGAIILSVEGELALTETSFASNPTDGAISNTTVSAEHGINWKQLPAPSLPWLSVACSNNGQSVIAVHGNGVYTSADGGATWTQRYSSSGWLHGSVSYDGTDFVACKGWPTTLYYSNDSGANWSQYLISETVYAAAPLVMPDPDPSRSYWNTYLVGSAAGHILRPLNSVSWDGPIGNFSVTPDSYQKLAVTPNAMYAAAATSTGVTITTDSGATWGYTLTQSGITAIAISDTGQYISAVANNWQIYVSNNYGASWSARGLIKAWSGITVSPSGQHQTAAHTATTGSTIYRSSDYGATWVEGESVPNAVSLASSPGSDGAYLYCATSTGSIYRSVAGEVSVSESTPGSDEVNCPRLVEIIEVLTSSDSLRESPVSLEVTETTDETDLTFNGQLPLLGCGWELLTNLPSGTSYALAISSNGSRQTIAMYSYLDGTDGHIYTSSNYGQTWTQRSVARKWKSVAMSADGVTQTAGAENGYVYVSIDGGLTWSSGVLVAVALSLSLSADGSIQTLVSATGIYVSTNSGASWTNRQTITSNTSPNIGMSATGVTQIVTNGSDATKCYVSVDSGTTWSNTNTPLLTSVAMSADGLTIVGASNRDPVWSTYSIRSSRDGGLTWNDNPTWTDHHLFSRRFGSFVISDNGSTALAISTSPGADLDHGVGIYLSRDFCRTWVWVGPLPSYYATGFSYAVGSSDLGYILTSKGGDACGYSPAYILRAGEISLDEFGPGSDTLGPSPQVTSITESNSGSDSSWAGHSIANAYLSEWLGSSDAVVIMGEVFMGEEGLIGDTIAGAKFVTATSVSLINSFEALRASGSALLLNSFTGRIFKIASFNRSAATLVNSFYARVGVTTNIKNSLTDTARVDGSAKLYLNLSGASDNPVRNLVYAYRITLDGSDVTAKVASCNVSYSLGNFCGEVNIVWSDDSLFELIDPSNLARNYKNQRLEVFTRIVGEGDWVSQGRFFLERRGTSVSYTAISATSWGRNEPAVLDGPYALPIFKKWDENTTALAIVNELRGNVVVDWGVMDYPILGSNFSAEGSMPIDVISTLAAAVGGIVYTESDGVLYVRYRFE